MIERFLVFRFNATPEEAEMSREEILKKGKEEFLKEKNGGKP
jgi:hypothetical protein